MIKPKLYAAGAAAALAAVAVAYVVVARGDGPVRAGALLVEPAAIAFGAQQDRVTLTLTNDGTSALGFDIAADQSWLAMQPAVGVVPRGARAEIDVIAERTGLAGGTVTAGLEVRTVDGSATIPVTLAVGEVPPVSGPARLEATTLLRFGASSTAADLRIANGGAQPLQWEASPADPFVVLERVAGDVAGGEAIIVRASVDRSGLTQGAISSSIALSSNGGAATVVVEIDTEAIPLLVVPKPSLDFGSAREGTKTLALEVRNGGLAPLSYQASVARAWLRVAAGASGTIQPGERVAVQVSYVFDQAPEGPQDLELRITSSGGDSVVEVRGVHDTFAPYAQDRTMGEARERCPGGACALYRMASARITDDTDITDAQVRYQFCRGAPQSPITCDDHRFIPMSRSSGDLFAVEVGSLPACSAGQGSYILWWIYTEDSLGNLQLFPGTKTPEHQTHCRTDGTLG